MPTRPIDRLMFAQGGLCFFCKRPLSKADATVEHLIASSKNGSNSDDNCVACCRTVNGLLGSMSLKEKMQVVLNQKGQFRCPNQPNPTTVNAPIAKSASIQKALPSDVQVALLKPKTVVAFTPDHTAQAIQFLEKRGASRPTTVKTLTSSLVTFFKKDLSEADIVSLTKHLEARGIIGMSGTKVTYPSAKQEVKPANPDRAAITRLGDIRQRRPTDRHDLAGASLADAESILQLGYPDPLLGSP